jgi:hypothetical protein
MVRAVSPKTGSRSDAGRDQRGRVSVQQQREVPNIREATHGPGALGLRRHQGSSRSIQGAGHLVGWSAGPTIHRENEPQEQLPGKCRRAPLKQLEEGVDPKATSAKKGPIPESPSQTPLEPPFLGNVLPQRQLLLRLDEMSLKIGNLIVPGCGFSRLRF